MPRIFSYSQFEKGSEVVRGYADKHSPVVFCDSVAARGAKLKVSVRVGRTIAHPNKLDHRFEYIQLWDLETLLGEVRFSYAEFDGTPAMVEAEFYVVPSVSMRLKALAYCNRHGLWESEEVFVKVVDRAQ